MTPILSVTLAERVTVADSDVTSTDEGVMVNEVTSGGSVSTPLLETIVKDLLPSVLTP